MTGEKKTGPGPPWSIDKAIKFPIYTYNFSYVNVSIHFYNITKYLKCIYVVTHYSPVE